MDAPARNDGAFCLLLIDISHKPADGTCKQCDQYSLYGTCCAKEHYAVHKSEQNALNKVTGSKTEFKAYNIDDAFVKVFGEGVFTAISNLVGTPALVSGGVQLMGWHFNESTLLSLAGSVERMGE